jgi:hypothetical protein
MLGRRTIFHLPMVDSCLKCNGLSLSRNVLIPRSGKQIASNQIPMRNVLHF